MTDKKCIMVVENFKEDLRTLTDMIEKNTELSVVSAPDADIAEQMFEVEMFKTKKYSTPEIIIIDVILPGHDGFELASSLAKRKESQNIPVLFIVASTDIQNKKRIFQFGGKDYIEKPFVMEEVLTRIDVQLNYKRIKDELMIKSELLEDNEKLLLSRGREIKGLLEITKFIDSDTDTDKMLMAITKKVIPEHLQYPDRTYCEIEIDKKVFSNFTNVYSSNNFSLVVPIRVNGKERGTLRVGYEKSEGKLLSNFEKMMMTVYASKISHMIEKREIRVLEENVSGLLKTTMDAYRDGLLIMSPDGTTRYNDNFKAIWGINEAFLRKEGGKKLIAEMKNKLSDPDKFDEMTKSISVNGKGGEGVIGFKDGRSFILTTFKLDTEGYGISYIWNFHDNTEETRIKKELAALRDKNNQLEQMVKNRNI